jgi:hypothetical protein
MPMRRSCRVLVVLVMATVLSGTISALGLSGCRKRKVAGLTQHE